jgi:hypothetical protein
MSEGAANSTVLQIHACAVQAIHRNEFAPVMPNFQPRSSTRWVHQGLSGQTTTADQHLMELRASSSVPDNAAALDAVLCWIIILFPIAIFIRIRQLCNTFHLAFF